MSSLFVHMLVFVFWFSHVECHLPAITRRFGQWFWHYEVTVTDETLEFDIDLHYAFVYAKGLLIP